MCFLGGGRLSGGAELGRAESSQQPKGRGWRQGSFCVTCVTAGGTRASLTGRRDGPVGERPGGPLAPAAPSPYSSPHHPTPPTAHLGLGHADRQPPKALGLIPLQRRAGLLAVLHAGRAIHCGGYLLNLLLRSEWGTWCSKQGMRWWDHSRGWWGCAPCQRGTCYDTQTPAAQRASSLCQPSPHLRPHPQHPSHPTLSVRLSG